MLKAILGSRFTYWILSLYALIVTWWLYLQSIENPGNSVYMFNWTYGIIGLSAAVYSFWLAYHKWGGHRSVIGRGLIFLGLGLLGQWLGLQVWTYYNLIAKVDVSYPSWADAGYFALVPAYTLAALMFAKASGATFSLKKQSAKAQVLLVPGLALLAAYIFFAQGVGFDTSNVAKTLLDFGYPLGEIIPAAIGLLILTLSHSLLGGTMRNRIRFLVFAFFLQSITEYAFIYTSGNETYVNGGWNDLLYATSYTVMALGIISFREHK